MDPWRQQILADIGLATWIRRDQLQSMEVAVEAAEAPYASGTASTGPAANVSRRSEPAPNAEAGSGATAAGSALSALSASLGESPAKPVARGTLVPGATAAALDPSAEKPVLPVRYPEVACLWCGDAVLFCLPSGLHGQVRLAKDILASAASNWTQATEQVVFRWAQLQASGFDPSESERALLAFAEKRIEVCNARWVLCTPTLQPLLAELILPPKSRLLGLAELADLARKPTLKQALWQAIETTREVSAADG